MDMTIDEDTLRELPGRAGADRPPARPVSLPARNGFTETLPVPVRDYRGHDITGASPAALENFEAALATFQRWRIGADLLLDRALLEAPGFTMAHVLGAYLTLLSRDPARVRLARTAHANARASGANPREQMHLAAIRTALDDDYEGAKTRLAALLDAFPRDVLALQVAHAFDHATGETERMAARVASVLPAWSPSMPGHASVLAMHAFSLAECDDTARAERAAREALDLDPFDARAHHALAHVCEMTGRAEAGIRGLLDTRAYWAIGTTVATHCWWHIALFHLARDDAAGAVSIYDEHVRAARSTDVADLIDASALLWRIQLTGGPVGSRWTELAAAWAPHVTDGFCSFNDVHAMLAFVGAGNHALAEALEHELVRRARLCTRHGETTRQIGLPACRAIVAFGQGDHARSAGLLGWISTHVPRIGGSRAQRDVLGLTLRQAVERLRRPHWQVAA